MAERTLDRNLTVQLTTAGLTKFVMNLGYRMVYPFLPAIARGLGVSIQAAGLLVTVRSTVGLASPLFGPLSDRLGRRKMLVTGLLLLAGGTAVVAGLPVYAAAVVGFLLLGLASVIFVPNVHAFLGDQVPYHQRGRVIGAMEISWAIAALVGVPAVGLIIERWGWRAPFFLLSGLGVLGTLGILSGLPANDSGKTATSSGLSIRSAFGLVLANRGAAVMLGVTLLASGAIETVFIVYGAWMESAFGLSVGRLGLVTAVIGVAELVGEIGVGGLVDRFGKHRSVAAGLFLTALAYVALPLVPSQLAWALGGLFFIFLTFEFTIVATIPLVTELVPAARGTMMSLNVGAMSVGRAIGAALGTALWSVGGLLGNGLVAGAATFLAFGLLVAFVREG